MHTSVPPLSEPSGIAADDRVVRPTRKPSAGSGAPVEPTPRSRAEVEVAPGLAGPALRQAMRNGALVPRYVVPVSAASRHSVAEVGPGRVAVEQHDASSPTSSPETR